MHIIERTSSININSFMAILGNRGALIGRFPWNLGNSNGDFVRVFFDYDASKMVFSYAYGGECRQLNIGFSSINSNLGKGALWCFVCPITQKRCRKLYFIAGNFVHRSAYKRTYYENQIMSRNWRERDRHVSSILKLNKQHDSFYSRPMRISYGDKLTKRWRAYLKYIHSTGFVLEKSYAINNQIWTQ